MFMDSSMIVYFTDVWLYSQRCHIEAYSETCQASKMELTAQIVSGWKQLSISAKQSIWDVWQDSEYTSGHMLRNPSKKDKYFFSEFQVKTVRCFLMFLWYLRVSLLMESIFCLVYVGIYPSCYSYDLTVWYDFLHLFFNVNWYCFSMELFLLLFLISFLVYRDT